MLLVSLFAAEIKFRNYLSAGNILMTLINMLNDA